MPPASPPRPDEEGLTVIPPNERYCAAVCRNGHVVNDALDPPAPPPLPRPPGPPAWVEGSSVASGVVEGSSSIGSSPPLPPPLPNVPRHCGRCGAAVVRACGSCEAPLLGGERFAQGGLKSAMKEPDPFCWDCGEPYPWATREQRLGQLYNLIDEEDLDEAERLVVVEQIAVLSEPVDEVSDEQQIRAGERLRGLAPKVWEAALPILQSLLTAKAKEKLGLPP